MKNDVYMQDRRRAVRASARGRVVIHGDTYGQGEIVDVSARGMRLLLAGPRTLSCRDDHVDLELRFDGAKGDWWSLSGRIVRSGLRGEIAIAFDDTPMGFAGWIQTELIDPVVVRRSPAARAIRARDCARVEHRGQSLLAA